MKLIKIISSFVLLLCSFSLANAGYTYGDTLTYTFSMLSGYYSDVGVITAYIFDDPTDITSDTYLQQAAMTKITSNGGSLDTLFYGEWIIPSDAEIGSYFLGLQWTYNGTNYSTVEAFEVGPFSVTMIDTLGGYGYITQDHCGGAIEIPGGIPAYNAMIKVKFQGTTQLLTVTEVDASGNFKVWVPSSGEYDIHVEYPGYTFGVCGSITPTVP